MCQCSSFGGAFSLKALESGAIIAVRRGPTPRCCQIRRVVKGGRNRKKPHRESCFDREDVGDPLGPCRRNSLDHPPLDCAADRGRRDRPCRSGRLRRARFRRRCPARRRASQRSSPFPPVNGAAPRPPSVGAPSQLVSRVNGRARRVAGSRGSSGGRAPPPPQAGAVAKTA